VSSLPQLDRKGILRARRDASGLADRGVGDYRYQTAFKPDRKEAP
jgi:hypothetical protein